jgi:hypothetical protein
MRYHLLGIFSVLAWMGILLTPLQGQAANTGDALAYSLIYHVYFGKSTEVQRLLEKGADPNAKDEHGWTALAIASARSDIAEATAISSLLIEKGAQLNVKSGDSYPIFNAILNKNAPLAAVLLEHEVDLKVLDAKGQSVLAIAKKMEEQTIIYYLEKKYFEEEQLRTYLTSQLRYQQLMRKFTLANCYFQYWSFYLSSKQDEKMDEAALRTRINGFVSEISTVAAVGSPHFTSFRSESLNPFAANVRKAIFAELNDMISNRNRKANGVGTEADAVKRCTRMLERTKI